MATCEELFLILHALSKVAIPASVAAKPSVLLDTLIDAGHAMMKLRSRLAASPSQVDDGAILTVLYLAMFEGSVGNEVGFEVHLRQVKSMIAARGGIDSLCLDSHGRMFVSE
jgi:hypothetical protein